MTQVPKRYVQIREIGTHKVEKQFDITGKSDRYIERLMDGMSINLNHEEYYIHDTQDDLDELQDQPRLDPNSTTDDRRRRDELNCAFCPPHKKENATFSKRGKGKPRSKNHR